jgi:phosphoribosylamine--glycine ligase
MGNLLWYEKGTNRLFDEVLNPLKAHRREIGFHGDMDVNCIINADGVCPLELTPLNR